MEKKEREREKSGKRKDVDSGVENGRERLFVNEREKEYSSIGKKFSKRCSLIVVVGDINWNITSASNDVNAIILLSFDS